MRSIKAEGALFGDILQGSFVDSYRQSRNKTQGKEKVVVKISYQEPIVQSNPWTPLHYAIRAVGGVTLRQKKEKN